MTETTNLFCEYRENPLGIQEKKPRLSRQLSSDRTCIVETAYHIAAATTLAKPDAGVWDLWDTGRTESDQSVSVEYGGKELGADQVFCWKVRSWCYGDDPTKWSRVGYWSAGIQGNADWKGEWISHPNEQALAPAYFRKVISIDKDVSRALVHGAALGIYECYLNGRRIGSDFFSPGWSDYTIRVYYRTYDVTVLLENCDIVL